MRRGVKFLEHTSIVVMITSNMLLGQSSELLWGFLSTIQIIYFFPLLQLYYPDNLSTLLACFSASTLQLPVPQSLSLKNNIEQGLSLSDKVNMPALNDRYESLSYQSTSILINGGNVFNVFTQGLIVCVLVYGFKAILFTLQSNIKLYESELKNLETSQNQNSSTAIHKNQQKESKLRTLIKKKIKEMSNEYKFNFFLRTGGQVFLEASILSLLNIRYMQTDNFYQILSIVISFVFICGLGFFFIWSLRFSCIHYNEYKYRECIDIPEYESMFGQYKTQYLPQMLFNTYFMTRRILYACIIVFMIDFPVFQAFTFMLICVPILAYHLTMNPYLSKVNNVVMNINETSFILIGTFFYVFSEPMSDTNQQSILGWVVIGIIMGVCTLNFFVLWVLKFIMIRSEFLQWWRAFREKQKLKKQSQHKERRETLEIIKISQNKVPDFYTMRISKENKLITPKFKNEEMLKPSQFYRINNNH